jgi:hypothetical protein
MGKKPDLQEVDRAARECGIPPARRRDFGRYLERCKRQGHGGTKNGRGDFVYEELLKEAHEFLSEGA